jgi:hypothetical protein
MAVVLGPGQQILDLLDKGLPALRIDPAEQLFSLLPRQSQALQGGADRLATAGPAEPLAHPADQTAQGPARRRIGAGSAADRWAARTVSPRAASISGQRGAAAGALIGQRLRAAGVVEMQPLHPRLRVTVRALGNAGGAALLSDFIERQKALAGARMGRARRQPTQIRRRLAPPRMVNAQHNRSEQGGIASTLGPVMA